MLPAFYIVSAVLYGSTAVLYLISTVRTLRLQLKEKKKMSYNTAVQMHVGIVIFTVAAFIHGVVSGRVILHSNPREGLKP